MGKDKVAAGVKGKSPKAGMVDPKGAWTKVQERTIAKKGAKLKKAENGTKFGMLSVKAGVDKNPNPTAADRIAGAKGLAKKGAKVAKKGCMSCGGKMKY